jgi:uracil-DNA glycosylase
MQVSDYIKCDDFPCADVEQSGYTVPGVEVDPAHITIVLISEAAPVKPADHYYAGGESLFQQTTVQAFNDAGAKVASVQEILDLGVYLTTAVKCGKTGYAVQTGTVLACSQLLEKEIALFPNVRGFLLMGDVAIKAFNAIAKRTSGKPAIPAGSTYKIRGQVFTFQDKRVLPSYLQAGPSFFIEKTKRRMIAEDIGTALKLREEPPAKVTK